MTGANSLFVLVAAVLAAGCTLAGAEFLSEHLSGMTPYTYAKTGHGLPYTPPADCRLSGLDAVFRHGSRYPSRRAALAVRGLEDLVARHRDELLMDWMRTWRNPYTNRTAELLCQNGVDELASLGREYRAKYASVLTPYNPNSVLFTSTFVCHHHNSPLTPPFTPHLLFRIVTPHFGGHVSFFFPCTLLMQKTRASQSAVSFGNAMIGDGGETPLALSAESQKRDRVLRFFDNCARYRQALPATLEETRVYLRAHIGAVAANVAARTGLPAAELLAETRGVSALETMWDACQSDFVVRRELREWCSVFSLDDAKVFEYYDDMVDFYTFAYSNNTVEPNINLLMAAPLLRDMLEHLAAADPAAARTGQPHAALRFAHAETVIPLTAIMQLFTDGEPLRASWSPERIAARRWRNNVVAPLATNIALLRYECAAPDGTESSFVELQHNEIVYPIPGCGARRLCPLDRVLRVFAPILENDWDKMCAVEK